MTKPKTVKRKAGRPKAVIDWDQVGKMLEAGCYATGIAAALGIDENTLYTRCKSDNKCDFGAYRQQKLAKGDDLLRQVQFKSAMGGNAVMQIWLGKQRLAQADKSEVNQTIKNITVQWIDADPLSSPDYGSSETSDSVH